MRLTNILERRFSDSAAQPLHQAHVQVDALLQGVQQGLGDARFIALTFAAPLAISRLSGLWRQVAFTRNIAQSEAALSAVPAFNFLTRSSWSARSLGGLATGALIAGCAEEPSVGDSNLQAPRALEAQAAEFNVTAQVSSGTSSGFQASLNERGDLAVAWADSSPSAVFLRAFPEMANPTVVAEVARPEGAIAFAPSVSNTDNGDILVAWTHSLGVDSPTGVKARRYTGGVQAQGDSFNIVPIEMHEPLVAGTVALNPDGSFIVVSNENSASCGVCARNYSANNAQSSVITLSEPGEVVLSSDLSSSAQGEWAWAGVVARNDGQSEIRFRAYVPGRGFGAPASITLPSAGIMGGIQLAVLPGNRSLVVWQSPQGLRGQLFSSAGRILSSVLEINSLPPGSNFSVASDEAGAFVVAWEDQGRIRASLLASDGRSIAANLDISGSSAQNSDVSVTANERGRVSFVWRHFQERPAGYSLVARNYQIRY